jgi:acetyl-CoA C-acetyltransferase
MLAAQSIRAGDGDLFVAGGVESMSRAPYLVDGRMGELKYGNVTLKDSLLVDGLWCPFENWGMGDAAEFIAEEYEVTREAMDRFALASHQKAVAAQDTGKFKDEIVPVEVKERKKTVIVDTDEGPRRDTSLEALANLKPAFKKDGRVTAGNAPGLNDGASAVVVASAAKANEIGEQPLARIIGYAQAALDPKYLFAAPAKAIPKLLEKVGWTGWDWEKVNVHGGSIALGHPVGASGARVLTTLIYALKDRGLKRGIASLCLGGAEAVALAVEMV